MALSGSRLRRVVAEKILDTTQRLQCSSFLVVTNFWLREYYILPQQELHWSPWVEATWKASVS